MTARNSRCVCGLLVRHHFERAGRFERFVPCEETKYRHPRATARPVSLANQLRASIRAREVVTGLRATHGTVIGAIQPGRRITS